MRVKVNATYRYNPVLLDRVDGRTDLQKGDLVRVVNLPGCPRANTMGHCHVADPAHRKIHRAALLQFVGADPQGGTLMKRLPTWKKTLERLVKVSKNDKKRRKVVKIRATTEEKKKLLLTFFAEMERVLKEGQKK
jgi:hypothetical protein